MSSKLIIGLPLDLRVRYVVLWGELGRHGAPVITLRGTLRIVRVKMLLQSVVGLLMGDVDDRIGAMQMKEVSAALGRRLASCGLLIGKVGTRSIVARDAFLPRLITSAASGR